jgi:hypothetical protein
MALATEREYGLFINGELMEPASGEVRDLAEPATREPLARAAMAGEADIGRSRSTRSASRRAADTESYPCLAPVRVRWRHAQTDGVLASGSAKPITRLVL